MDFQTTLNQTKTVSGGGTSDARRQHTFGKPLPKFPVDPTVRGRWMESEGDASGENWNKGKKGKGKFSLGMSNRATTVPYTAGYDDGAVPDRGYRAGSIL